VLRLLCNMYNLCKTEQFACILQVLTLPLPGLVCCCHVYTNVIQATDQSFADATAPSLDSSTVMPTATDVSGTAEISPGASLDLSSELNSLDSSTTPQVVTWIIFCNAQLVYMCSHLQYVCTVLHCSVTCCAELSCFAITGVPLQAAYIVH
jgi:hypothetical protein